MQIFTESHMNEQKRYKRRSKKTMQKGLKFHHHFSIMFITYFASFPIAV